MMNVECGVEKVRGGDVLGDNGFWEDLCEEETAVECAGMKKFSVL